MPKTEQIHRPDFPDEYERMLHEIFNTLVDTGASKREIRVAISSYHFYLFERFPEVNPTPISDHLNQWLDEFPGSRDRIPLGLDLERSALTSAIAKIGRMVREFDYSFEESERVVQMFQSLMRFVLKGSDKLVHSVRRAITGE